jgi:hypothetical protein
MSVYPRFILLHEQLTVQSAALLLAANGDQILLAEREQIGAVLLLEHLNCSKKTMASLVESYPIKNPH